MKHVWWILCAVLAAGCSGSDSEPTDNEDPTNPQGIDPGENNQTKSFFASLTWEIEDVEVGDPTLKSGFQARLVRGDDGTLYYVYLRNVGSLVEGDGQDCDIALFSSGGPAAAVRYEVHVAVRAPGANTWSVETVPLENTDADRNKPFVGNLLGLDATFNSSGQLVIAMAAGGDGTFICASSDLVLATRTGTDRYQFDVPVTDSNACCGAAEAPACEAGSCTSGTDVGAWPAIAQRPEGGLAVAFVDTHFSANEEKAGWEFWDNGPVVGVRPWSNLGKSSVLHYAGGVPLLVGTGFGAAGGLHVLRRIGSTGTTADWVAQDLRPGWAIGENIAIAEASDGTLGLLFHAITDGTATINDLVYCWSTNQGETWSAPCETIDSRTTHLGQHPSLTFDSQDRAVVSYYVCGSTSSCSVSQDGLRMAWRRDLADWEVIDVHAVASRNVGTYSQIVLDENDVPTIVFQDVGRGAAMVAQGRIDEASEP